jgi:hypothetical protein
MRQEQPYLINSSWSSAPENDAVKASSHGDMLNEDIYNIFLSGIREKCTLEEKFLIGYEVTRSKSQVK